MRRGRSWPRWKRAPPGGTRATSTGFVAVYADDATFVTKDGVLRGKAAIADRYRASFAPSGNTRGKLSFEAVAFRTIGSAQQLLIARWKLTSAEKEESGMTTLLWERRPVGWRIVADHSS